MTTLPLEVIFHSIDIGLHNDPPTLRILSLTCHAIHSYTHTYLFRTVTLRVEQGLSSNVPGFLAIIRCSPGILSAIRSLNMMLGMDMGTANEEQIAEVDTLCSFMQEELPNLNSVYLSLREWASDRVGQTPQFRTSLSRLLGTPKLSKLMVCGHTSCDMSLLENAKHVVNFTIQTVQSGPNDSIVTDALSSNAAIQSPPRLRPTTFTLYEPHRKSAVLSSAHCDLTAVSTFRIYGIELPFQAIPGYLAKFSSTLTRFEIYLTSYQAYYGPEEPQPLDLSALFHLRHLTITFHAKFRQGQLYVDSEIEFHWIINTLRSLPRSNIIESIRILTRCNTLSYLRDIDWALFDSSVFGPNSNKSKWASLKTLDLGFSKHGEYDSIPLINEFQDVWLPGTLLNFREKTEAVLNVGCEMGVSFMDYVPRDIFSLAY